MASGGYACGDAETPGLVGGGYGSFVNGGPGAPGLPPLNASSTLPGSFDPAGRPGFEHSLLRRGSAFAKLESGVNLAELIFVPWLFVVVVLACILQAGTYGYYRMIVFIPVTLLPLILFCLRHYYNRQRHPEVVLALLCLTAATISLVVGSYAVTTSLMEYHRLSQGASYANVLPSEAGASKIDATTLSFTNETLVDTSRTFGFTDTRDKRAKTYCVAPISDGNLYRRRFQFWAAGVNCCEARSNFNCFVSGSLGAHGALVMSKAAQRNQGFHLAVLGAQAAYDLTAGDHFLLVQWHEDPVGYRNSLWHSTSMLFSIVAGSYLIISVMIGLAVHPWVNAKAGCSTGREEDPAEFEGSPLQPMDGAASRKSSREPPAGAAAAAAAAAMAGGSASTLPASAKDASDKVLPGVAVRGRSRGRSPGDCC